MKQYRVTKYNPACRDAGGAYQKDEWTDFSDIGKTFSGHILTADEYYEVEKHYIQMCVEEDMKKQGYEMIMASTQVDEEAQLFYRKPGYKDCGGLTVDISGFVQPMEMLPTFFEGRMDHERIL